MHGGHQQGRRVEGPARQVPQVSAGINTCLFPTLADQHTLTPGLSPLVLTITTTAMLRLPLKEAATLGLRLPPELLLAMHKQVQCPNVYLCRIIPFSYWIILCNQAYCVLNEVFFASYYSHRRTAVSRAWKEKRATARDKVRFSIYPFASAIWETLF